MRREVHREENAKGEAIQDKLRQMEKDGRAQYLYNGSHRRERKKKEGNI